MSNFAKVNKNCIFFFFIKMMNLAKKDIKTMILQKYFFDLSDED